MRQLLLVTSLLGLGASIRVEFEEIKLLRGVEGGTMVLEASLGVLNEGAEQEVIDFFVAIATLLQVTRSHHFASQAALRFINRLHVSYPLIRYFPYVGIEGPLDHIRVVLLVGVGTRERIEACFGAALFSNLFNFQGLHATACLTPR